MTENNSFEEQCLNEYKKAKDSGRDPRKPENLEALRKVYEENYSTSSTPKDILETYNWILVNKGLIERESPIEFSLTYEDSGDSKVDYYWEANGIYRVKFKMSKTQSWRETVKTPVLSWQRFDVQQITENPEPFDENYDVEINSHLYQDLSIDAVLTRLCKYGHVCTPINRIPFPWLFREYIDRRNPPRLQCTKHCGFTKESGFIMPGDGKYRIQFQGDIQKKFKPFFEKVMKIKNDEYIEEMAKYYVKLIRKYVCIDHLLQFLAVGIIVPFMPALIEHTQFVPMIAAYSFKPHTGKTTMMMLITYGLWGVPSDKYLKPDSINSESRLGDYASFGRFGILIDDAEKLDIKIQSTLKVKATGIPEHTRKNKDQTLAMDRDLDAVIFLTYNRRPAMFSTPADLDRLFEILVNSEMTPESKKKWDKLMKLITPGVIGRHLINIVNKGLIYDQIERQFDNCGSSGSDNPRSDTIYRFQLLGLRFLHDYFDVVLNDDEIEMFTAETLGIIKASKKIRLDDVIGVLKTQLTDQDKDEPDDKGIKHITHKRARWIDNEVCTCDYKAKDQKTMSGWAYTSANFDDLKKTPTGKAANLPDALKDFAVMLKEYWPHVHYGKHVLDDENRTNAKSIFIPKDVVELGSSQEVLSKFSEIGDDDE